MVTTIAGVLVMWGLVSYLHSGDAHAHGSKQGVHSEEDHHDEEEHSEEDHHDEEGHE
jgi:ZIP family zinc transporter